MIVHPEVDVPVIASLIAATIPQDQERRRLLPAAITARGVTRKHGREESIAELALPRRESAGHRIDHALAGQDVALRREVLARDAAGPLDASGSREGRCLAARVHEARLSLLPALIALQHGIERRPRRHPTRHQPKAVGPEVRVRPRLRGYGANARLRPGDDRADARELRGDSDAEIAVPGIEPHDRERHRTTPPIGLSAGRPAGRAGTPNGTPPDAPACAPLRWPPFRAASRRRAPGPRTPGRGADPGLSAGSRLL